MKYHIVCRMGDEDAFAPNLLPGEDIINVDFQEQSALGTYSTSIAAEFEKLNVVPSPASIDLLNAAIGAYMADLRVSRREADDDWTRDFCLHLAVHDVASWEANRGEFAEMLSFLTGDIWQISVRPVPGYELHSKLGERGAAHPTPDAVCLFSGGLDSTIGVIDILARGGLPLFVGHHGRGTIATSTSQHNVIQQLAGEFGEAKTPFSQFFVAPVKRAPGTSETSTRARSILFLGLGIAVATAISARTLVIPENGFISLNVPLSNARLGSFSTRTTHPYFIGLLQDLLNKLGIAVELVLPYRFLTKGEMMRECGNRKLLQRVIPLTMSCSHPEANRFGPARDPNAHCGYCVPCIIRRAAIAASGLEDNSKYVFPSLNESLLSTKATDVKTLKVALKRYEQQEPRISDLLVAGPLSGTDEELEAYREMFVRGLDEVGRFLGLGENAALR